MKLKEKRQDNENLHKIEDFVNECKMEVQVMKQHMKSQQLMVKQREIGRAVQEIRVAERGEEGSENIIKKYIHKYGLTPKQQNSYLLAINKI